METKIQELFSLKNKVAVVTGGAGWLGSAMTRSLAEAGALVVALDINPQSLESLEQYAAENNLDIFTKVCDTVSDESQMEQAIDQIAEEYGRLDILVNCAIKSKCDNLDKINSEHLRETYKNSTAYFILSRRAAMHMRKVGGGSIINIASMYGMITGYPKVYEGLTPPNHFLIRQIKRLFFR
jgi:NAD(P)-dependent dehydrogenase (short-subunit alcohol dehydrogenase family)